MFASKWEQRQAARAKSRTRFDDRQAFDRFFQLSTPPEWFTLLRSGRPEDYAVLGRRFQEAGNEPAMRHAQLVEGELKKAHKRVSRSFRMFLRWFRTHGRGTRFDLVESARQSCRKGGAGWLTDSKIQLRVKPEDRAEVAGMEWETKGGRLLEDSLCSEMMKRYVKFDWAAYPLEPVKEYTFDLNRHDEVDVLSAWLEGPKGTVIMDMTYLGLIARYFPGAVLMVGNVNQHGSRDPIVIRWKDEDVGLVMPRQD